MKKRNKKWAKEKEFRRLREEFYDNRKAQRDLGWVELETPLFIGWDAVLDLRSDIKNREDAWVFEWICRNVTESVYSKKIEDFPWNKKSYRHDYIVPHIRCISAEKYDDLDPQIKKYFALDIFGSRFGIIPNRYKYQFGNWYICTVPDFYFEIKYVKVYTNKVKLIDEILLQEEDDLKKELYSKYYNDFRHYKGVPRHFRNHLNRIQRKKSKQDLRRQINDEEPRYTPNYKDAKWLWW